jgi:hypothetical protein
VIMSVPHLLRRFSTNTGETDVRRQVPVATATELLSAVVRPLALGALPADPPHDARPLRGLGV